MLPATKSCRTKLNEFNEYCTGVVIALEPGCFYSTTVRYEIVEFRRWEPEVSNTAWCTVLLRCLTDVEPHPCWVRASVAAKGAVEGEMKKQGFSLEGLEKLLRWGTLTIVTPIHAENWYRPDPACLAV